MERKDGGTLDDLKEDEKEMKKYKIIVLTLQGKPLTFTVSEYKIIEGDFVEFIDRFTGIIKRFHASRVEIVEVGGDSNA